MNRALAPEEIFAIYQAGSAGKCTSAEQVPFTNNLVAYYPFNGNANDATGNGNNGTIIGDVIPATDHFGNTSNAYHFDGSSSAIEVTNTLFNIGQPGYTISGWFCSDNASQSDQLIINTIPETGLGTEFNNTGVRGRVSFSVGTASGSWTVLGAAGINTNYANQTWYQLVFTKSGTNYTSYINGQIDCQQTDSAAYRVQPQRRVHHWLDQSDKRKRARNVFRPAG